MSLRVTLDHAERLTTPILHNDPFDRMLIAQALVERATIVSHDPQFEQYDVVILRV
jgi:PIN domain nuclease of toxin-antitoxin system